VLEIQTRALHLLDHMLILGEGHPRRALAESPATITGIARARACSKKPPRRSGRAVDITARIKRRQVLGGLISEYRRAA
jgi:hypothetical protein